MSDPESDEPSYCVFGTGTWRDLFPRIPRPVLAIGTQQLYRVVIHGTGFSLPLDGRDESIIGFFTTRFVAAVNVRDAEIKACASVSTEWKQCGHEACAECSPLLELEELELVHGRFRLRSGAGFAFYAASE